MIQHNIDLARLLPRGQAVCHGKLKFKMAPSGFEDVRTFMDEVYALVQEQQ